MGALSVASAMAVTSVNVVGYVNVPLVANQSKMLTAPLQAANNTLEAILPNGPDGLTVQKWNPGINQFDVIASYIPFVGWDPPGTTLAPGEGFNVVLDSSTTLTFVGDVRQSGAGQLTTPLVNGYNLVGSQVPQQGGIGSVLGFDGSLANNGVTVQIWDPTAGAYSTAIYSYIPFVGWDPSEPVLGMAEACIIVTAEDGLTWSRTFNVQ